MKNDKDIRDELQEISPLLFQMRALERNPFKVPEGYFGALKEEIFLAIDTGLADEIGKKAFSVPDNYFGQLTADIMEKITTGETSAERPEGKLIDLNSHRKRKPFSVRTMSVMAASVAIFLLLGVLSARFFLQDNIESSGFAVTEEEALDYIENNWADFESEDLLALVDFSDGEIAADAADGLEDALELYLEEHIDELDEYLLTSEI